MVPYIRKKVFRKAVAAAYFGAVNVVVGVERWFDSRRLHHQKEAPRNGYFS